MLFPSAGLNKVLCLGTDGQQLPGATLHAMRDPTRPCQGALVAVGRVLYSPGCLHLPWRAHGHPRWKCLRCRSSALGVLPGSRRVGGQGGPGGFVAPLRGLLRLAQKDWAKMVWAIVRVSCHHAGLVPLLHRHFQGLPWDPMLSLSSLCEKRKDTQGFTWYTTVPTPQGWRQPLLQASYLTYQCEEHWELLLKTCRCQAVLKIRFFYVIGGPGGSVAGWTGWRGSQVSGPATLLLSLRGAGKGQFIHSLAVLSKDFHLLPHHWLKSKYKKMMII